MHVVSIAVNVPGPVAASRLAHLGAHVTKVEPPDGDPLSRYAPSWYAELCRGQDVQRVDLASRDGRAGLDALLAGADVLVTSSRPKSLRRLGLEAAALAARYPGLCQVAILGHAAPQQEASGHDLTYQATAGLLEPPHLPRALVADLAGAERVVGATLSLLLERTRAGRGGHLEIALADAARDFAAPFRHGLTTPSGVLGGASPRYAWYRAADGWVAVAALEQRSADRLTSAVAPDPLCAESLSALFGTRRAAEWADWAEQQDVPLAVIPDQQGPTWYGHTRSGGQR
ncbi:MAG: CoA transferase [Gemmatimonadaceae bacterium]